MSFAFPSSAELTLIAQDKTPRMIQDRLGFQIMPFEESDTHLLEWEQMDNWTGLQAVRGLNGEPTRVKKIGSKKYLMEPGVYGEYSVLDENDLTRRRRLGSFGTPIDVSDLVLMEQERLMGRRLDRQEQVIWALLASGIFTVVGEDGVVRHTDAYTMQTFTAGVTWATSATAVPLANFRSVQLLSRGRSVSFGTEAMAIMNRTTFNSLMSNTNANDLFGRRPSGLGTIAGIADVNRVLNMEGLPSVVIYDEGYLDDTATFQLFVPNNKVVVVGKRPAGQRIAAFRLTRNANNPDLAPGVYQKTVDWGDKKVPRTIEVHDGVNGGPVVYYPGSIVVMTV
jgi:hypothetical protein